MILIYMKYKILYTYLSIYLLFPSVDSSWVLGHLRHIIRLGFPHFLGQPAVVRGAVTWRRVQVAVDGVERHGAVAQRHGCRHESALQERRGPAVERFVSERPW